jgi:hypothetical protein
MSPSVTKLLDLIDAGIVTPANAREAIRQAGGDALCTLEAVRALAASGSGSSGGAITVPKVVFVDATNGDNGTAVIGDPSKPYQTFAAGYAAGRATAAAFAMELGAGSHDYYPSVSEASLEFCVRISGRGINLTSLNIYGDRPTESNQNGTKGYSINTQVDNLTILINASGASVSESDMQTYTCGDGGDITLFGTAKLSSVFSNGGSESSASSGITTMMPGNGGIVNIRGLDCRSLNFSVFQGTAQGGSVSDGTLSFDNCDLRGSINSGAYISAGRCSYDSGSFFVTNDKGGNATY